MVCVFSHPNHEIAILATIARNKPDRLVFITDGGGIHRVNETRSVLSRFSLDDRAVFLQYPEDEFYKALLNLDLAYFSKIKDSIKCVLQDSDSTDIYCDAVEFYNPIHDMTLPIVKSLGISSNINVWEVPLVYQDINGEFLVQKPPKDCAEATCLRLEYEEQMIKKDIFRKEYNSLGEDMEKLISIDPTLTESEWFLKNRSYPNCIYPNSQQVIRYNYRGENLVNEGVLSTAINYTTHYLGVVEAIIESV
jgi:hypothetical protein